MTLDVWLVGRLALELDERLRGARVQSVRSESLGLTVACHRRGAPVALIASLAPEAPLLAAVSDDPAEHESGPGGWAGAVAALLRNATIEAVHAVPDDRIINVDLSSRSAFGVPSQHRLVFELEPRKSNALVLRPIEDGAFTVLAVAKMISGAEGARDVAVGKQYEAPPKRPRFTDELFDPVPALDDRQRVRDEPRALARKLSAADPSCSPPLAREAVQRATRGDAAPSFARAFEEWSALRSEVVRAAGDTRAPVFTYMRGDIVGACHCVPLSWAPGTAQTHASLNEVCSSQLAVARGKRNAPLAAALRKKLGVMLGRCADETIRLIAAQRAGAEADALRIAGDAIYANLSAIASGETSFTTPDGNIVVLDPLLDPKENAQAYFRRFRKARSGLPRIAERLRALDANRALWEQMLWEVERAEGAGDAAAGVFEEVADAIGLRRTGGERKVARAPVRRDRTVALPSGAVAHIGRSPKDNDRVTFAVAGPDDYWFHARGIPGAHVVIRSADGRSTPTDDDILVAASLAAGQSRAADATKVEVDFTRRKHVRKQGKGKPGLVWYTDFKTVLVAPRKI